MPEQMSGPWWVVLAAALPSVGSGMWIVWRWWLERGDRHREAVMTREDREARNLEAQRVVLSADQARMFDQFRAEIARLRALLEEVEADRDRGWDLARFYYRLCRDLQHEMRNARLIVTSLVGRMSPPEQEPAWRQYDVPTDMEAPLPRERRDPR